MCRVFLCAGLLAVSSKVDGASAGIFWRPLYEPGCGGAIVSVEVSPHNPRHVLSGGDMLGTAVSLDGGENWKPGLGLPSYEMATPTFHPTRTNDVWIGSCMGPFLSHDGGCSWEWKRNGMPRPSRGRYTAIVEKILIDRSRSGRLLAFAGSSRGWTKSCETQGAVWESLDDGENWQRLGTICETGFTTHAVKGANIVKAFWDAEQIDGVHLFARGAGWFFSPDGGRTWRLRSPCGLTGQMTALTGSPGDSRVFWGVTEPGKPDADGRRSPGRLWKSVDGGRTFALADAGIRLLAHSNPNLVTHFNEIAVSPVDPDVLYVSDLSYSSSGIWLSEDGAKSWRRVVDKRSIETACYAGPGMRISTSPTERGTAYAYNSEYILKTEDCGRTWTDMTAHRPDPAQPRLWRGRGWNGWCSRGVVFNPYRKGEVMVHGMDASRGWLSVDGCRSWRYVAANVPPWSGGKGAAFAKNGFIYVTTGQHNGNNGVFVSRDGGVSWTSRSGAVCGLPDRNSGEYGGVWVDPESGLSAFVFHGEQMYRTADGGETWKVDSDCSETGVFAEDPTRKGRFYLKNRKGVFMTEDWKAFRAIGLDGPAEGGIACDAKGRVLVGRGRSGTNFGLFRYDPSSGAWTRLFFHRLACAVAVDPTDPRRIAMTTNDCPYHDFAGGDGVYVSSDDGETWQSANEGLHIRRLTCIAFDPYTPERLIAGTGGGGFVTACWAK